MDTKETVLSFLSSKNDIPGETESDQLACEYLDQGILDSMGIIEMVVDFEKKFGIRFSPENMQSLEFRTIGGLIGIIDNLRKEQPSE